MAESTSSGSSSKVEELSTHLAELERLMNLHGGGADPDFKKQMENLMAATERAAHEPVSEAALQMERHEATIRAMPSTSVGDEEYPEDDEEYPEDDEGVFESDRDSHIDDNHPMQFNLNGEHAVSFSLEGAVVALTALPGTPLAGWSGKALDFERFGDLSKRRFAGITAPMSIFSLCDITNSNFRDSVMPRAEFVNAKGHSVVFDGAKLPGSNFKKAVLGLEWTQTANGAKRTSFAGCDLQGCDFTDADLRSVDFTGANLSGAKFKGAKLEGTIFTNAILEDADFDRAVIEKANFSSSKLRGASFAGTSVDSCIFTNAELQEADLNEAVFTKCKFDLAKFADYMENPSKSPKDPDRFSIDMETSAHVRRTVFIGSTYTDAVIPDTIGGIKIDKAVGKVNGAVAAAAATAAVGFGYTMLSNAMPGDMTMAQAMTAMTDALGSGASFGVGALVVMHAAKWATKKVDSVVKKAAEGFFSDTFIKIRKFATNFMEDPSIAPEGKLNAVLVYMTDKRMAQNFNRALDVVVKNGAANESFLRRLSLVSDLKNVVICDSRMADEAIRLMVDFMRDKRIPKGGFTIVRPDSGGGPVDAPTVLKVNEDGTYSAAWHDEKGLASTANFSADGSLIYEAARNSDGKVERICNHGDERVREFLIGMSKRQGKEVLSMMSVAVTADIQKLERDAASDVEFPKDTHFATLKSGYVIIRDRINSRIDNPDGPAVVSVDGKDKQWWSNGLKQDDPEQSFVQKVTKMAGSMSV